MWITATGKKINFETEFKKTITTNFDKDLKIYIASDSQNIKAKTRFATVVVLKLGNNGARVFVQIKHTMRIGRILKRKERFGPTDMGLLRKRLLLEAELSIKAAKYVSGLLDDICLELFCKTGFLKEITMQVDADVNINSKYKSEQFMKEIMGYIIGNRFIACCKPNATMATNVADAFTKSIKRG